MEHPKLLNLVSRLIIHTLFSLAKKNLNSFWRGCFCQYINQFIMWLGNLTTPPKSANKHVFSIRDMGRQVLRWSFFFLLCTSLLFLPCILYILNLF